VLDDEVAILAEPTAGSLGDAILQAIESPERARAMGERARHLAETKYSYDAYLNRTREACALLAGEIAPQVVRDLA
jgi:glycosyltransferase involved in cell wall biosynthesis